MTNEHIWANCLNLKGLYSNLPVECRANGNIWTDDEGLKIERLGIVIRGGIIMYASIRKEDVEKWTLGVLSSFKIIQRWSSV